MSLSKRYYENLPRRSSETKCLLLVHTAALLLLLQPLFPVCNTSPHISFVPDYLGKLLRGERSATSSSSSSSFML
jgi:hypothetical protein